jgi:hypothetical protein
VQVHAAVPATLVVAIRARLAGDEELAGGQHGVAGPAHAVLQPGQRRYGFTVEPGVKPPPIARLSSGLSGCAIRLA